MFEHDGGDPQVEWRLAVPTCWSPAGRSVFREAVRLAGFETRHGHRVSYISEAKAAATWAAQQLQGSTNIQPGDAIIVCDCGGVTTDVATLVVDENRQFVLQPQQGRASERRGGVDVDFTLLQTRNIANLAPTQATTIRITVDKAKKQYTGDDNVSIRSDYSTGRRGRRPTYHFSENDLRDAYKPVLQTIIDLVTHHITLAGNRVKKLILIGGVGTSPYIRLRINQLLGPLLGGIILLDQQKSIGAVSVEVLQAHKAADQSPHAPLAAYNLPTGEPVEERAVRICWHIRDKGDLTMTWEVFHRDGEDMPQPRVPLAVLEHSVADGLIPVW
ncbi:hypothetical protein BO94DRAFT_621769 [Aspergillus sclerotioniger CBS 115572]|uniref:Actin-like ATPase domain-containing protein n=1 Tax=Aspergillus sclerotioniger CBS 115572 TaxID=1450535 RepID=A0A317X736_9EURO|nr:hypothetical protein BO94DRAFT_621769 [Aspergillus sclerotioniger CBS 115572]PWY94359.1 hypothetical protein BO94DRAFT_621769 [Aspergillus sclerotioniger CBS 115572]